jgi:hypothetical protein
MVSLAWGLPFVGLDVARVECFQVDVEVAGLRVGSVHGSLVMTQLPRNLRSRSVATQPVTINQVDTNARVGSEVIVDDRAT